LRHAEIERRRQAVYEALYQVLGTLAAQDQVILQLRFRKDRGVADIARDLRLEQKPLYRRIPRMLRVLRDRLRAAGVTPQDVVLLLDEGFSEES
jgi:RNA polymerase sigma factor for flagellar operon FliA